MATMTATEAAVNVMRKEGIEVAFGILGAAINPIYTSLRKLGGIRHLPARRVEGASHMAEGYSRAARGSIGVCIGTSGPPGTDMRSGPRKLDSTISASSGQAASLAAVS